ncbi:MAG: type II 3-dehydroquinate dehydratase [Clostridiales bacterium]|nr:type II 3-dehydroquinate dehydratase [Clostridiales bacterium]
MHKILVINGPNLNLLGKREPLVYGTETLVQLENSIKEYSKNIGLNTTCVWSNSEGQIIDFLHKSIEKYDGIILNAGAYSHYSIAIRDAIASINIPVIEVHMSNIYSRESFRRRSVIAEVCLGQITGFGKLSYILALQYFKKDDN